MPNISIDSERISATEEIIRPYIRRTPIIEADGVDFGLGSVSLIFKLELLQHSGSFKARGAFANLLLRRIPEAGVVAASGGNHGAAVAFAAMKLGVPAKIFVPTVASSEKIERIRGYGANLVVTGERYAEALAASERWAAESGALTVHAYDQPETILGQGSVGLEFEQQSPHLDSLLVAVGGGGLIGGVASWHANRIKIVGVEPQAAPTLHNALLAGHPIDSPAGGIAADSLAPKRVGELMFPIAQKYVHKVVLVTDSEIQQGQEAIWKVLRMVAEPGGAAAFAAILSGRYKPQSGERVGILICGGNTTAVDFTQASGAKPADNPAPAASTAACQSIEGDGDVRLRETKGVRNFSASSHTASRGILAVRAHRESDLRLRAHRQESRPALDGQTRRGSHYRARRRGGPGRRHTVARNASRRDWRSPQDHTNPQTDGAGEQCADLHGATSCRQWRFRTSR